MASVQFNKLVFWLAAALVVFHSLAAYNLGPIPFQWVAQAGFIGLFVTVLGRTGKLHFPGLKLYLILLLWGAFVTAVVLVLEGAHQTILEQATTGFWVYV